MSKFAFLRSDHRCHAGTCPWVVRIKAGWLAGGRHKVVGREGGGAGNPRASESRRSLLKLPALHAPAAANDAACLAHAAGAATYAPPATTNATRGERAATAA